MRPRDQLESTVEASAPDAQQARRAPRTRNELRTALTSLVFLAGAVALQLGRQPGVRAWNTIWAEDGRNFTADALAAPALQTILRGYNGYAQVVPRGIALATRVLPVEAFAAYLAVSAAVVTALLGLVVVRSARDWVGSSAMRWSLGVMVVAAPVIFSEINVAVTNLGWPFLVATFWVVASREQGRGDVVVRCLTVALAALTTTTVVVFLPWAVAVAAYRRRRADLAVLASLVAALTVQFAADLFSSSSKTSATRDPLDLLDAFGLRVLGSLVTGERWLPELWTERGALLIVGSVSVFGAIVVASRPGRMDTERQLLAAGAGVMGLGTFVVTMWIRGTQAIDLEAPGAVALGGGRYAYVPVVLLFSALVVLVDGSGRAWLRRVLVAQTALVVVASLGLAGYRSEGPAWSTALASARAACRADPTRPSVEIPISPPPRWELEMACERLR